jgi:hypothetical protein
MVKPNVRSFRVMGMTIAWPSRTPLSSRLKERERAPEPSDIPQNGMHDLGKFRIDS